MPQVAMHTRATECLLVQGQQLTYYFNDLDGTLAEGAREAQRRARKMMEQSGLLAFVSLRTPELMMGESAYRASIEIGFSRSAPRCGMDDAGNRYYVPLENLPLFQEVLDAPILYAVGVGCFEKKGEGYAPDTEHDQTLGGEDWREMALLYLRSKIDPTGFFEQYLAPIDRRENWENGTTDVEPLPYRLTFEFDSLDLKREFKRRLSAMQKRTIVVDGAKVPLSAIAQHLRVVDESNPEKKRYVVYLLPRDGQKERAVNHIVSQISRRYRIPAHQSKVFIAGDTMTDFKAGLWGGHTLEGECLLVGRIGAFLAKCLPRHFAGKPIDAEFAGERLMKVIKRLQPAGRQGTYVFKIPHSGLKRTVIIGPEAYPGTEGAETILAHLQSTHAH